MTLERLNAHLALRQELKRCREALLTLETRATPGAQNLTGMPHTPGPNKSVENFAVRIADLRDKVNIMETDVKEDELEIATWIDMVRPYWTRLIFQLRYLDALPWRDVARSIGGNNSEDNIKMVVYRYMMEQNPEE